jgi:hypothetical protein
MKKYISFEYTIQLCKPHYEILEGDFEEYQLNERLCRESGVNYGYFKLHE